MPIAFLDRALRPVGVGRGKRHADVLETDSVFVQYRRIDLDPHRGQRAAADGDLTDAADLRQLLGDDRRCRVVHLALCHRVRGQRQDHDRRVGRIDLAIRRVARQPAWQQVARGIDRRLHIAGRSIDIAIELELQCDPGRAQRAGRRHFGDAGDSAE
jgi:hypothetical protein